jgi:DNA mismatch endonuclease (patch repair protein)
MADVVSREKRSEMMSGIRGKNTRPEIAIRKALFNQGFRYRLHDGKLPGKPDVVLPKYKAAIFVHGCFWHKHDCHLFRMPGSRREFWHAKIEGNLKRDKIALSRLHDANWRTLVIWECAMKGKTRLDETDLIAKVSFWIKSSGQHAEIKGVY